MKNGDLALVEPDKFLPYRARLLTAGETVIFFMVAFQVTWLAFIFWGDVSGNPAKIPPLIIYSILVGIAIKFAPSFWRQALGRSWHDLLRHERKAAWILFAIVLLVGILFAQQQRIWVFDEEGNAAAAAVVATDGVDAFFQHYGERRWLGRQHPPLVPLMYGGMMALFGPTLFVGRLSALILMLATGFLVYRLGNTLFPAPVGLLGALFFFTMPLVYRLGTAAMVEMPLVFFFTLAIYLTVEFGQQPAVIKIVFIGIVVGAGILSKYTMVIVLPIIFGVIAIFLSWKAALKYALSLAVTGALILLIWLIQAEELDVLSTQWETVIHYSGLVLTNQYGRRVLLESLTNRLPSALGVYSLPVIAFSTIHFWQDWRWSSLRTRWWRTAGVLFIWIGVVWLVLMLTLPDHRYFMISFPAIALLMAAGIQQAAARGEEMHPSIPLRISLLALLLGMSTLYLFVDWARNALLFVQ